MATRLAGTGLKTAIIEKEHFGGTCVNNGCIPTKTMVASARAAHVSRNANDYGVLVSGEVSDTNNPESSRVEKNAPCPEKLYIKRAALY